MLRKAETDEAVVDRARRVIAARRTFRWVMLIYAARFLELSGYMTFVAVRKIEKLDAEQLSMGFLSAKRTDFKHPQQPTRPPRCGVERSCSCFGSLGS